MGYYLVWERGGALHKKLNEPTFALISHIFKLRRASPKHIDEARKLYSTVVDKITFKDLVRSTKGGGLIWNTPARRKHIELNALKNE